MSRVRKLLVFLSAFLFWTPLILNAQKSWVPDALEARFHPEDGKPWFMKDGRTDSLDILHYTVRIERPDSEEKLLKGECVIRARVLRSDIKAFPLDLAGYQVNRVERNEKKLTFERKGQRLLLRFSQPLSRGDTVSFKVSYAGKPIIDPSGWGGTFIRNGVVFNLGVGFKARPHSYARTWFPCVDHFRERATYRFKVRAPKGKKAVCSGVLREVKELENGEKEWYWEMDRSVPPYLVSFAIGDFSTIRWDYESIDGREIPIRLDVAPSDSAKAVESFAHLKEALRTYEKRFGPYRWPRVGYVSVPFPSGAMEHATNIAYPQASVNGTHRSDELMAHELSHSWWGNLVTCATPWDMWINEGMASFSEFLFREEHEGKKAYREAVRKNHKKVLRSAHLQDGNEYRSVYGIPHAYTYGSHVYKKGADVVRTFRYLTGDSLFFSPLKRILKMKAYDNMATPRFAKLWERMSGKPMSAYFEDWLQRPGFPHFRLKHYDVEKKGNAYQVRVRVEQRMTHASKPYRMVPLELFFLGKDGERKRARLRISKEMKSERFSLPFEPVYVSVDPGGKLAQATLTDTATIRSGGVHAFDHVDAKMDPGKVKDPFHLQLRQHFIPAEVENGNGDPYEISKARYWSVGGTFSRDSSIRVIFELDGVQRTGVHPEALFFADQERIEEKKLVVLRRAPDDDEWKPCEACGIKTRRSPTDGRARLLIKGGFKG
ncbi:MAG: M1 family metallopeptidase, partial [Flavobacteriales bacterium]